MKYNWQREPETQRDSKIQALTYEVFFRYYFDNPIEYYTSFLYYQIMIPGHL